MHRRFPSLLALLLGLSVMAACGVGIAPGGDDDESGDSGDDGGDGPADRADAFPAEPILCATEYTVTGTDLAHTVTPGESCEGSGTWSISVGEATPDSEYTGCSEAPGDATFNLSVVAAGEGVYTASDNDDGGRTWTVEIRDKGGSCAATFQMDLGGGIEWSLIPSENGPDGPLHGTARFEKRSE
jgi:hypothetical protein